MSITTGFSGSLFVVAAPSGAGKSTLVNALLALEPGIKLSISTTTRPPRPGEQHGREYYFTSAEDFVARAAKVDDADRAYFRDEIKPLLNDPLIEFVGEIGDEEKSRFLGDAIALLFPIDWPEPFGLVMIEAMACGTPVIAWGCGSVPEVVDDGVTGRVVYSQAEAMSAVAEVAGYDRQRIRDTFERRFSAQTMARGYETLYRRACQPRDVPSRQMA